MLIDSFVQTALNGSYQRVTLQKLTGNSVRSFGSSWQNASNAGTYGASGFANGRVCTSSTTGGTPFVTASNGKTLYLLGGNFAGISATQAQGNLQVLDRISDCLLPHSSSTGDFTGLDATSRLGPTTGVGDGAQIIVEVQSSLSAGSNAFQLQYTNELGVSGRITPIFTTVASAVNNQLATTRMYIPLQAGDLGVRSIQRMIQIAGTATGTICICLVKPLLELAIPTGVCQAKDTIFDLHNLPVLYGNECFMYLYGCTAAINEMAVLELFIGEL